MKLGNKKRLLLLAVLIGLIFFPSFDDLESTYIPSWTWPKHRAIDQNNMPKAFYFYGSIPDGIFLRGLTMGGNEANNISTWSWFRIRFGSPLRPTTLDIDKNTWEWHLRHEGLYFSFNILFWIVVWVMVQIGVLIYRFIRKDIQGDYEVD